TLAPSTYCCLKGGLNTRKRIMCGNSTAMCCATLMPTRKSRSRISLWTSLLKDVR
ncbi:hypothetical protein IWW41_003763, partial [Coemansia sp. RSA 2522]